MTKREIRSIPIADITILPNRWRTDFGELDILANSIEHKGLLVPIAVNTDLVLIAGERRIEAHKLLGRTHIDAEIHTQDDLSCNIFEIIENIHRKQFNWREEALATEALHQMLVVESGENWTLKKTADKMQTNIADISRELNLAKALQTTPDIFDGCTNASMARKRLKKHKLNEAITELALRKKDSNSGQRAQEIVKHGDCLNLIHTIPDKSIDAVICDPFYGLDISDNKRSDDKQHIYDDDVNLYWSTMTTMINHLTPKVKDDAWIVLFCAMQNYTKLISLLELEGWNCDILPGIWNRGHGQTNQPDHKLGRCYEAFVYGYRGDAMLKTPGKPLVFQHAGVHPSQKIHDVQKPLSLMEDMVSMCCLPGHTVLDFMCGSGTTLCAAIKRGCRPIGFELDKQCYLVALNRVTDAIMLKDGGKANEIV